MKTFRRVLSLLLAATLLFACCSCGAPKQYRITFVCGENSQTVMVTEGEMPVFEGDTEKPEDAEHFYRFLGWDKTLSPATRNETYTARYCEYGLTTYTVTWIIKGLDDMVEQTYHEGEMPVPPEIETRYTANKKDYTFRSWNKEVVAVTEDMIYRANYDATPAYYAELENAKGGAKAILSMTFDDGIESTATYLNTQFEKYNLCGSCMLIVDGAVSSKSSRDRWFAIFEEGYLEPLSHSLTHSILPEEGWAKRNNQAFALANNYAAKYQKEIVSSKELLETYFNSDVIAFAPSNNTLSRFSYKVDDAGKIVYDASGNMIPVEDGGAMKVAQETYYAIRQGNRDFQSLNPGFGAGTGCWHNLSIRSLCAKDINNDASKATAWLDTAIRDGGWMITLCHAVETTVSDNHMTPAAAEAFFAYASEQVANGKLWCATFSEATKYIRERQQTTVSEVYENNRVKVTMTIDRNTPDNMYLDEDVFDEELTVKVRVPADWNHAYFKLNGQTQVSEVFTEGGVAFTRISLAPGADDTPLEVTLARFN